MKFLSVVWSLSTVLALGSFGVLLLQDRRLGVPLPYSVGIAFTAMAVLVPALFGLYERLRAKRPIRVRADAPTTAATRPASRPRTAEGLVLLDFSTASSTRENAA
jgi:hypothetical protein